jgi:hypothetical protein
VTGRVLELVDPPLTRGRAAVALDLALFFVGAGLCLSFMLTDPRRPHLWLLTAAVTLARGVSALVASRARWAGRLVVLVMTAFWIYEAVTFGLTLAWTTPVWVRVASPLLVVLVVVTARRPVAGVRVPLGLALGPWILTCLLGWRQQDGMLRCADLRRVGGQPGVSVLVPTFPADLPGRCADGDTFVIGRYPRRVWEAPEGGRFVVTTQFYGHFAHGGTPLPSRLSGSICEVRLDGSAPRCFGQGTAQAIRESEGEARLYVAAYQQKRPGHRGVLYALAREDPMRVLAERWFRDDTGEFYFDPAGDTIGVVFDQVSDLVPLRASDLTPGAPLPVRFDPGDTRYDPARGEGIFCFAAGPLFPERGEAYASVAFRGAPFRHHLLAPSSLYPSSWATLTWGCDFDPSSRRAFVASANLGWLAVLDLDSGRYLSRRFVGIGVRAVTWDPRRRVVYLADFLRGEVFAVEPDSGRETARWFVGRFVRQTVLTRDGRALLVTSNVGVVRVELPER